MFYRVDKKPDDLKGLVAAIFTGAGSVSAIVDDKWGHFKQTGFFTGVFVLEDASAARRRVDMSISFDHYATPDDRKFLEQLEGTRWRSWHNCFSVLRGRWTKKS